MDAFYHVFPCILWRRKFAGYPVGDPMLVGIGICQVLVFVYFVTCSELLLTHNMVDNSNKEWGFGQVRRYPPYLSSDVTDLFVSSLPI